MRFDGLATDEPDVTALVAQAIATSRQVQANWARVPLAGRLKLVRALRHLLADHASQLAEEVALVRHRPVAEVLVSEIIPFAEACRFLERKAASVLKPQRSGRSGRPLWLAGMSTEIRRDPHGVVLIIAPGNYPLLLPGVQLVQAIVAGNSVIWKPGPGTSAVAAELVCLLECAGFDPGLVAVLPESPAAARAAILTRPDKVVFTGSAETGEKILAQLAPLVIPATMELSGCDPVIICADADLDLAVKALTFGVQLNDGATCMAPKRVFVSATRATELEGRLAQAFDRGRIQLPANSDLNLLIEEALARGAHLIAGKIPCDDAFIGPLVLGGVPPAAALLRSNVFAPVLAIVTVANDHEAVMRANDCPYALTASIFSRGESTAREMATRLRAGLITINDLILPAADPRTPFGGRGRSGFGVTQGAEGLIEMTVPKVITVTRGKFRPGFEPLHAGDEDMFVSYLTLCHGSGLRCRWRAITRLLRLILSRRKTFAKN